MIYSDLRLITDEELDLYGEEFQHLELRNPLSFEEYVKFRPFIGSDKRRWEPIAYWKKVILEKYRKI